MPFTWDPKKDTAFSYDEERIKAIGILEGTEIVVIYTHRSGEQRRIISARPATRKEPLAFWQEMGR